MKYLIDLDGTLLDGEKSINNSEQFIHELQREKVDFAIMTNSTKSPRLISVRLAKVGINILNNQIINPIIAINAYLKSRNISKAFIVGSQLEVEQIVATNNITDPQIIILLDFEKENISYNDLHIIFMLLQQEIPIIAASGSVFYLKNNIKYLDTGSFVALFEKVLGMSIPIIGKPSKEYFNAGISLLQTTPENITVIGDDWMTDIQGAKNVNCNCILIKSGKYETGDENKCIPNKAISSLLEVLDNMVL